MQIKKIHIQNFKSLVDFELESPKQFCAFVGPNASGKSNIFEALEFMNYVVRYKNEAPSFFGGKELIESFYPTGQGGIVLNFKVGFMDELGIKFNAAFHKKNFLKFDFILVDDLEPTLFKDEKERKEFISTRKSEGYIYDFDYEIFIDNFSRIFVGKPELVRINSESKRLKADASNVAQIIGQIFQDEEKKQDFIDWLRLLIPEFENIEVRQSNIDGSFDFFVYEKGSSKPFPRKLLSDGTRNIFSLMAAVYQSNEPQFLCIEEPENGLHPYAIELLVDFFREKCEMEGHHIWLNTHSQTLVRAMNTDELVLVNKIEGRTKAKRVEHLPGIKTDEAWLTNTLGGGVLWSK